MNADQHAAIHDALRFAQQGPHDDLAMNADRAAGIALNALKRAGYVVVRARDLNLSLYGLPDQRDEAVKNLAAALDDYLGLNRSPQPTAPVEEEL